MIGTPYTHAMHAKRCHDAAQARQTLKTWVQVKTTGASCCARLIDAWKTPDNDMWKIEGVYPFSFLGSYPVRWVRQCSGLDGLCTCAGETGDRAKLAPHEATVYPVPGELL